MAELAADIRAWLGGFATEAENAGFLTQARLLIKRNRRISITLFSAFLLISALTLIFIVQLAEREQRALAARDKAEMEKQLRLTLRKRAAGHFYENAYRAEILHDFNLTLYYSEMVVDFVPENKEAHYLLGKLYLAQGKYDAALASFALASGEDLAEYRLLVKRFAAATTPVQRIELLRRCSELSGGKRLIAGICFYQPALIKKLGVFEIVAQVERDFSTASYDYDEKAASLKIRSPEFNFLPPASNSLTKVRPARVRSDLAVRSGPMIGE